MEKLLIVELQDGDNTRLDTACNLGCQAADLAEAAVIAIATKQEDTGMMPLGVMVQGKRSDIINLIAHAIVRTAEATGPEEGTLSYETLNITKAVTRAVCNILDAMLSEVDGDDG